MKHLNTTLSCFFPVTKVKTNYKRKYWSIQGIRASSKKLKILYEIKIRTKNIANIEHYKKYKKIYKQLLKNYRLKLYEKSENKSKTIWNIINCDTVKKH